MGEGSKDRRLYLRESSFSQVSHRLVGAINRSRAILIPEVIDSQNSDTAIIRGLIKGSKFVKEGQFPTARAEFRKALILQLPRAGWTIEEIEAAPNELSLPVPEISSEAQRPKVIHGKLDLNEPIPVSLSGEVFINLSIKDLLNLSTGTDYYFEEFKNELPDTILGIN